MMRKDIVEDNFGASITAARQSVAARPFLKWAGGKGQLLSALSDRLPGAIAASGKISRYVEPFLGGGAMFFCLKKHFEIDEACLSDVNEDLIVAYQSVRRDPENLIRRLRSLERSFIGRDEAQREKFFYATRDSFNTQRIGFDYKRFSMDWIDRAAYLIFLNKTCFNGLFRQNSDGEFNVPFGGYKKPVICNRDNIRRASEALAGAEIFCGDFSAAGRYIDRGTLVYCDPPYRPLNKTSSFTDYAKEGFGDADQKRLAEFFAKMDRRGAYMILSNSDPKNTDPNDGFFDDIYNSFRVERVPANRMINCNGRGRGAISELIISNYAPKRTLEPPPHSRASCEALQIGFGMLGGKALTLLGSNS